MKFIQILEITDIANTNVLLLLSNVSCEESYYYFMHLFRTRDLSFPIITAAGGDPTPAIEIHRKQIKKLQFFLN